MQSWNWRVVYTRPRSEKKVLSALQELGLEAYCPLAKTIRQWSDRKKKIEIPLIPSYVFVRVDEANKNKVFEVKHVMRYVYFMGKPARVRDSEIEAMKEVLQYTIDESTVETYKPGTDLTIRSGPFKGKEAIFHSQVNNAVVLLLKETGLKLTIKLSQGSFQGSSVGDA